jgi:hypothetical protein
MWHVLGIPLPSQKELLFLFPFLFLCPPLSPKYRIYCSLLSVQNDSISLPFFCCPFLTGYCSCIHTSFSRVLVFYSIHLLLLYSLLSLAVGLSTSRLFSRTYCFHILYPATRFPRRAFVGVLLRMYYLGIYIRRKVVVGQLASIFPRSLHRSVLKFACCGP